MLKPSDIESLIGQFVQARQVQEPPVDFPHELHERKAAVLSRRFEQPNLGEARFIDYIREGFQHELNAVLDQAIHSALNEIRALPITERAHHLESWIKECLDVSFELFWGILESATRMPDQLLDPNEPMEFLAFNEQLSLAFIKAYQTHPQRIELTSRIAAATDQHTQERPPVKFFRGAACPTGYPVLDTFGRLCEEGSHRFDTYTPLTRALRDMVSIATDEQQTGYATPSASISCGQLIHAIIEKYPGSTFFIEDDAYLGMLRNEPRVRRIETSRNQSILDALSPKKPGNSGKNVVILTSMQRDGTPNNTDPKITEIKAIAPDTLVIVDGAQDHLLYPNADAVLYSKRFGGAGTGVTMINKKTDEALGYSLSPRGTIRTGDLARAVGALRCELHSIHFMNHVRDLLNTPSLWDFSGWQPEQGGTYLGTLVQWIQSHYDESPHLQQHFTLNAPHTLETHNHWKSSRILTFKQRSTSPLDLKQVAETLKERHGIAVDWYSLRYPPTQDKYEAICALTQKPFSPQAAEELFEAIRKLEATRSEYLLTEHLTLPEVFNHSYEEPTPDLYQQQIQQFQRVAQEQQQLRIFLDIQMARSDIEALMNGLSGVVASLTQISD